MPDHPSTKHTAAWRSRREEYLRASGRHSDLVMEGFEPAAPSANWTVFAGGRRTRHTKPNRKASLFLVKNVGS